MAFQLFSFFHSLCHCFNFFSSNLNEESNWTTDSFVSLTFVIVPTIPPDVTILSPLFKLFHKLNSRLSTVDIEATGIFGLMDRSVVKEIMDIKERNRYIPGLRAWVGFKQIGIEIDRSARYDESPRIFLPQLYKLAFDSFTAFSGNLLSLPIIIGLLFFVMSVFFMVVILFLKLVYDVGPWGWASLVCIILLTSGIQFAFIGLLGEFISRIMVEVKGRPLYIIRKKYK